jgi:long-chain acyl-CoA synthetase
MANAKDVEEFASKTDIKLLKFDELIQLGADNPHEAVPPKADDLSCIMYTSGTTGTPKGVQLTHANLCGVIGGVQHLTSEYIFKQDVFISMLPLAHILALSVDFYLSYIGMKIGYSSPRTLTDTNVRNCVGDLKALQPTLLIAVPQVYETIRKGIFNKVNSSGAVTKFLFNSVLSLKQFLRGKNLPNGMFDFVFGSIKQLTGGKLRLAVCGGAPLSASLQDFITDALCPMIQGYGLTEVCGLSVVGTPDVAKTGEIGKLSPAFEIKLKDVPDAGYSHKNPNPQGELWYKGQPLSTGYFKNEQETKDAFTEEGWFKTGDVAEITERGTLKIIDRKKNLVKLSNGEYIALEKIESFYRNNQVVNAICVCADSERPKPVAVIVANLDALKNICSERGLTVPEDLEQASKSEEITHLVYKECLDEAKKSGLKGTEIISGIYLAPEEWTVDNDFLTAAQKMKRRNIQSSYKDQINKLFSQIPN